MNSYPPVILEHTFTPSVASIWSAITEVRKMKQWFFDNIPDFHPEVGFKTRFEVKTPKMIFIQLWTLAEVVPLRKITYDCSYEGFQGASRVTFKLFEEQDGTRLQLMHAGGGSFPEEIPEFSRDSCLEGWNYFIKNRLQSFLANKEHPLGD